MKQSSYQAPSVLLYEWVVEQGFNVSGSTAEDVGGRNEELEW